MYLDIDVGNTRAKWRVLGQDTLNGTIVSGVDEILDHALSLKKEVKLLEGLRIASVKGEAWEQSLKRACDECDLPLTIVQVERDALHLRNQYPDVSRLGVDRWCAMVAVWHRMQHDFPHAEYACVVDAGTAMTVDVILKKDTAAVHKGGYIVPGLSMQIDAIQSGTGRISLNREIDRPSIHLGNDTQQAVQHGIVAAAVALIKETLAREEAEQQASGLLWLCGGDAGRLRPFLQAHNPLESNDLVLEGIALLS